MKKVLTLSLSVILMTQIFSCIGYSVKSASIPYPKYLHHKQDHPAKGWKNLVVYDRLDEADHYNELAKIVITGNASATEEKLLNKLRKEAGRYHADAILHLETRQVYRSSFDGISASLNIISLFSDSDDYLELDMGGEYTTLEVEGIAIRFIEH